MNSETIARIIKLIDQTGDKIVMMDPATERAVVIMDLAAYEKLTAGQRNDSAVSHQSANTPSLFAEQPHSAPTAAQPAPVAANVSASRETAPEPVQESVQKPVVESKHLDPKKPSIYSKSGQKDPLSVSAFTDLTQSDLLDKINRDIAAWKTAQDRKRTDELKAAVTAGPAAEIFDALEDEERFYLEPIE